MSRQLYSFSITSFGHYCTMFSCHRKLFINEHIFAEVRLNATEEDPSITITGFCPGGVYLFRVVAVNKYGVAAEFDKGVFAEIQEESCPGSPSRECSE